VNLGNPAEFTMLELAETVMKVAGHRVEIIKKPLPPDDPRRRCPDISKAKRLLGFEPRIALDSGLRLTHDNFADRLGRQP
jgi:UDP-glucuronate decarboxylase